MQETFYLLTFASTHQSINFENILKQNQIPNQIIPIPTNISATCGLSIKIPETHFQALKLVISENQTIENLYKVQKDGLNKSYELIT